MRFLIGLVSGAALMLLLASALETTDRDWLDRLPAWFDGLATTVGDALALPPRPAAGPAPMTAGTEPVADVDAGAGPDAGAMRTALAEPEPASRPIPRPPDPHPLDGVDETDGTDGMAGARSAGDENVQEIVQRLFGDAAPPPAAAATDAAVMDATTAAPAGTGDPDGRSAQPVWVPFHSQMSASGFAARLSESLDHPFRVERRGPGRYQVVFAYRDEPQRQAVLAEAAAVTGLPL